MNQTDDRLEDDLRAMLADRAARVTPDPDARRAIDDRITHGTPAEVVPLDPHRTRSWPLRAAAAAACVAIVAAGAIAFARADRESEAPVAADGADARGPAPSGTDLDAFPGSGEPIFGESTAFDRPFTDPASAAEAYLASRGVGPDIAFADPVVDGDEATVDYVTSQPAPDGGPDSLELGRGRIHLWDSGDEWVVQAAVADGITIDSVSIAFGDGAQDLVRVQGSTSGEQTSALRVTTTDGDDLLQAGAGEDLDRGGDTGGRVPLDAGGFDVTLAATPAAGSVHVLAEKLGGSVFAVTEFSLEAPGRPLQRFPAGTDPAQAANEFAVAQGWQVVRTESQADANARAGWVSVESGTGPVIVAYEIDREDRVVIVGAWDETFDSPTVEVSDDEVRIGYQVPVDGQVLVSVTPFFSEFEGDHEVPRPQPEGEVWFTTSHPTDGIEPVIVRITFTGDDGIRRLAVLSV